MPMTSPDNPSPATIDCKRCSRYGAEFRLGTVPDSDDQWIVSEMTITDQCGLARHCGGRSLKAAMVNARGQRQQWRVDQRLADQIRRRSASTHIAILPDQHDKAVPELQCLIEPRQVIRIERDHDDTKELAVQADDLAGELHRIASGHAPDHRLADEQRCPVMNRHARGNARDHADRPAEAIGPRLLCSSTPFTPMIEICMV